MQNMTQSVLGLLENLGVEASLRDEAVLIARFKNSSWVEQALRSLGIEAKAVKEDSSLAGIGMAIPADDDGLEKLSRALEILLEPEALLFDVDDTLADVTDSYRAATVAVAVSFGARVTFEDITEAKAAGDANNDWELTWRMIKERGIDASLEDVTEKFEELYQGSPTNPGVREKESLIPPKELIERLAARITLGIVTGRPLKDALTFLEAKGIRSLFSALATMEDGPLKPSPEPCLLALKRLGVQRAWMVGDTPDDMRSAKAAGVLALGVVAPADDPEVARPALIQAGAARVLSSISKIEELLP